MLGTPSHPLPLDRVRSVERDRQHEKYVTAVSEKSKKSAKTKEICSKTLPRDLPCSIIRDDSNSDKKAFLQEAGQRRRTSSAARGALERCISREASLCRLENFNEMVILKLRDYMLSAWLGCNLNDISFCSLLPMTPQLLPDVSQNLAESWALYNYIANTSRPGLVQPTVRNPNKALCTINARTSEILTANEMAAALFGMSAENLIGRKLSDYIKLKYTNSEVLESDVGETGQILEVSGRVLECVDSSGIRIPVSVWLKHLESGKQEQDDPKCLVVMEPVERLVCRLLISNDGVIKALDHPTLALFEYSSEELIGQNIDTIIHGLKGTFANKEKKCKLSVTGKTRNDKSFPCFTIMKKKRVSELSPGEVGEFIPELINLEDLPSEEESILVTIWVFANISGLITVLPNGNIHSCNATLSRMLFGYKLEELRGRNMAEILPDFFTPVSESAFRLNRPILEDDDDMALPHDVLEELNSSSEGAYSVQESIAFKNLQRTLEMMEQASNEVIKKKSEEIIDDDLTNLSDIPTENDADIEHLTNINGMNANNSCGDAFPENEFAKLRQSINGAGQPMVCEGSYRGTGLHKDGGTVDLLYAVRRVEIHPDNDETCDTANFLWVVWVSRDPDSDSFPLQAFSLSNSHMFYSSQFNGAQQSKVNNRPPFQQQFSTTEMLQILDSSVCSGVDYSRSVSNSSYMPDQLSSVPSFQATPSHIFSTQHSTVKENDTLPMGASGDRSPAIEAFDFAYESLSVIGRGAFGFVKTAKRLADNTEVVVKYIRKCKLSSDHLVKVPASSVKSRQQCNSEPKTDDASLQIQNVIVPREIHMLCLMEHPSIIAVDDWWDGVEFFYLVMPKHGAGMDLFEFIDRSPDLDEPLVSYIFRQLADAVSYMHSFGIVHRDIKDENVILDDKFVIKLIDFGAATFVQPGEKFRTFCGTMEFCSPEILLGNEYDCYAADIWSMGITLYTLMFGENPFFDYQETIEAVLKPPFALSNSLLEVLSWMLDPNPYSRGKASQILKHPWVQQQVNISDYNFNTVLPNSEFQGNVANDYRLNSEEEVTVAALHNRFLSDDLVQPLYPLSTFDPPPTQLQMNANSLQEDEEELTEAYRKVLNLD